LREKWEGRGATPVEQMNGRGKQEMMPSKKKLLHTKNEDRKCMRVKKFCHRLQH
jgi:hypothetical protein